VSVWWCCFVSIELNCPLPVGSSPSLSGGGVIACISALSWCVFIRNNTTTQAEWRAYRQGAIKFYIDGTTPPHRQGGEPIGKGHTYMITTSIFRELYTHKHPCRCASNPNKENPQNGVWIKGRQPPSKILKTILTRFHWFFMVFFRVHCFKLEHFDFICDGSAIYRTVKEFWQRNTRWWPYTVEIFCGSEMEKEKINKLHCGRKNNLWRPWRHPHELHKTDTAGRRQHVQT
jgi:hypothetical protein